ncbi:MAG: TonB-dependent receptor [Nitrospirota bacterium]
MNNLCMLLVFLFLSSSAFAEEIRLEEVVVTAARLEEPLEETTSSVTIIRSEDIEKKGIDFLTDALREVPELNLVQNGGSGKVATVLLRGGSSSHTLVMVDGIKVNSPATGSFDFSGVSVDDVERIEIVKGPQSTFYGSEAMVGVINIITKRGRDKPEAIASFAAGSYGTYKPATTIMGNYKKLDYRLTGSYFHTEGISAAKAGTERDGYNNTSVSGKIGFRPTEKIDLEFVGKYVYDRSELDGFDFFARRAVDDPNFIQRRNHSILSGKGRFYLSEAWEQVINISRVTEILKFSDPDDTFNNAEMMTEVDTLDWQNNLQISENFIVTAGAEYKKEKGENTGNFERFLDNKALYLNNKLKLFDETMVLNAGLRYDDLEISGSKTTFRIGAIYYIKPAALNIKGTYGTGFRAPALNELFFPFYGNPDLKPEETISWEAGLEKALFQDRVSLSFTYFEQRYKNLIETNPLTFTAANISRAEVKGVEAGASFKLSDALLVRTLYTYLDTEDRRTGRRLPLRPQDKFDFSVDISLNDWSFYASYIFVGQRFDSSVDRNLSSYSVIDVSGNYKISKKISLFARIDNLLDEEYEESGSFGTPGFSVFGGVKVTIL